MITTKYLQYETQTPVSVDGGALLPVRSSAARPKVGGQEQPGSSRKSVGITIQLCDSEEEEFFV